MGPVLMVAVVAATVLGSEVTAADSDEEHCVVVVVGQEDDGEFQTTEPVCFGTEAEAALWAVAIPVETFRSHVEAPVSKPAASGAQGVTLASVTIGRHYDGADGSGSSIRIVGTSCSGGHWNTGSTWANRISSSYNGCARLRHYDKPGKSGAYEDTYGKGQTDNLSTLNNRTESVSYHSS